MLNCRNKGTINNANIYVMSIWGQDKDIQLVTHLMSFKVFVKVTISKLHKIWKQHIL